MVETSGKRRHHCCYYSKRRRWFVYTLAVVLKFGIDCEQTVSLIPPRSATVRSPTETRFCKNTNKNNDNDNGDEDCNRTNDPNECGSTGDDDDGSNTTIIDLDIEEFRQRKRKLTLQSRQQRWHQPPNPLLEDPVEFVQALLGAFQQQRKNRNSNSHESAAFCLLRSSTPSWRRILLRSVGAPPDATNDQVAPTLQNAMERPSNQFAILTKKIKEEIDFDFDDEEDLSTRINSIQKCWHFPSEPVIFEDEDDDDGNNNNNNNNNGHQLGGKGRVTIDNCWIESRLRSPHDDQLLAVVGWSLQRRRIKNTEDGYNIMDTADVDANESLLSCWLLDGIDWQDFRDDFRPGIGREEWERICG
eukprot:jgi/Psemu1/181323/e_gw1.19.28.1